MRDKLTFKQIERLQEPGRYADGGNLWLQVRSASNKSWLLRYTINGRAREMGLGPFPDVGLAEAREKARVERVRLSERLDPLEERNRLLAERRHAQVSSMMFRDAAAKVIENREADWSAEHARQWRASIAEVDPVLGDLPVATIDTPLVFKAVEPIWQRAQVTARRTLQRIEVVLDWAKANNGRSGDNPARWKKHFEHLLKDDHQVKPHPALPEIELRAFMRALRRRTGISFRALEFAILTGMRTDAVLGARWDEISGDVWTVPPERLKTRKKPKRPVKPLPVPLAERALEIISEMPRTSPYVFPSARTGGRMNRHALDDALKTINAEVTVHGFRSTFEDWTAENTAFPKEVRDQALGHAIPDKVEAAYRRGALLKKRRRLMERWAKFCGCDGDKPARAGATVTSIGEGRRA
jgi:integrase